MNPPTNPTNRGLLTAIVTILTMKLIDYLDLGHNYYGLIYAGILELVELIIDHAPSDLPWSQLLDFDYRLLLLLSIPFLGWYLYRFLLSLRSWWIEQNRVEMSTMTIYNPSYVKDIAEYIRVSPECFQNISAFKLGDPRLISQIAMNSSLSNNYEFNTNAYSRAPLENHLIGIDDSRFEVTGEMYWRVHVEKITKKSGDGSTEEDFNLKYVQINLESENPSAVEDYVDKIRDYVANMNSKRVTQYHVKILTDNNSYDTTNDLQVIYSGPPPNLLDRELRFIKTFFHPSRDMLWEMIKKIEFDPEFFYSHGQAPQIGLLLHGPPGTGKSTFAYRVGMALARHIISVDIRSIKYKSRLWQIIKRPRVQTTMTARDCIFIFDEFDLTVRDLYYRDRFNNNLIHMWISKMDRELAEPEIVVEEDDEPEEKAESKKRDRLVNSKKKNNKNPNSRYPSLNLNHEEIQLTDLLEIFQGPVPIDGLIAIATTNHFDEIKKMCPALFRPGRLTPIHFGYASQVTIIEICQHYFQRAPDFYVPEQTHIPTSKVIEVVMNAKLQDDDYGYFRDELEREFDGNSDSE